MLKNTRLAAFAAALLIAVASAAIAPIAHAQAQPAPAAAPAAPAADATAAPAAPAAKAAPAKATEVVDNPYGLEALWKGGDIVAKITLGILVIMSMGSWYIIITKVYEQYKMGKQARAAERTFWVAPTVQQGAAALKKGSPFRFIAETGLEATSKHTGLLEKVDMNEWITMSIQRAIDNVSSSMQDGLAFLATVGSTAPFVGLFGTVWGIYHALTAIGIAGQASIDKVAGPVGEALIMTAIGLAVAVPAVLGYNWLVRRNKAQMDVVRGFGMRPSRRAAVDARRSNPSGPDIMAMNVGSPTGDEDETISTINTTPLVDVMLVLLIIFLITIPVVTTSIPVTLPKERNEVRETKPENIVDLGGRARQDLLERPADPDDDRADRSAEEDLGPARRSRRSRFAATAAPTTIPSAGSSTRASGRGSRRSASSPSRRSAAESSRHCKRNNRWQ